MSLVFVLCRLNFCMLCHTDKQGDKARQSKHPKKKSGHLTSFKGQGRECPHLKSMVPLLLVSNVLKMLLLKLSALPLGKILEYISTNWSLVSSPLGQSARNPSYHSCTHKCQGSSVTSVSSMPSVPLHRHRCQVPSVKCPEVSRSVKCQVPSVMRQVSSAKCQVSSVKKFQVCQVSRSVMC